MNMIKAKCIKNSDPEFKGWGLSHDLEVGKEYEVERIDMSQSNTAVFLARNPRWPYNSVIFEFYEDGKPLNIYQDRRFNKYLK